MVGWQGNRSSSRLSACSWPCHGAAYPQPCSPGLSMLRLDWLWHSRHHRRVRCGCHTSKQSHRPSKKRNQAIGYAGSGLANDFVDLNAPLLAPRRSWPQKTQKATKKGMPLPRSSRPRRAPSSLVALRVFCGHPPVYGRRVLFVHFLAPPPRRRFLAGHCGFLSVPSAPSAVDLLSSRNRLCASVPPW